LLNESPKRPQPPHPAKTPLAMIPPDAKRKMLLGLINQPRDSNRVSSISERPAQVYGNKPLPLTALLLLIKYAPLTGTRKMERGPYLGSPQYGFHPEGGHNDFFGDGPSYGLGREKNPKKTSARPTPKGNGRRSEARN